MIVAEFEQLRALEDKEIIDDLEFTVTANPDIYRCEKNLGTFNGHEVILNATYYDHIPSVTFNFRVKGFKAICRYCINDTGHKDKQTGRLTRTHKHTPETEDCFRNNLPLVTERTEFTIAGFQDVEIIWRSICNEANILHGGKIIKN